jgi:hypothetical protein
MVKGRVLFGAVLPLFILAVIFAFVAPAVLAQEFGDNAVYTMQEEYRIELNDVGDAKITDTITYDQTWFDEYGYLFEENPNLLSRRYREDTDVGEVENFDVEIDQGDGTITITFDTPGLAYNFDDNWTVYGYAQYDPTDESNDQVVLETAWTGVNNEFTLYQDMDLEEKVVVDLPDGTTDASFDASSGAVEYVLPYNADEAKGGVLADNKTIFLIIFALVMALSLFLFIFAITRKTAEAPVAAAGVMPAAGPPAAPPQAAPPQATPPEAAPTARFCKKCGHPKGSPDERFCRKCGNPHDTT